jgi:hypothetical protein
LKIPLLAGFFVIKMKGSGKRGSLGIAFVIGWSFVALFQG